jgi:hypothetical protein
VVTIQSTSLTLKDRSAAPADPNRRKIAFKSVTGGDASAHQIVVPARGTAGDPTPGGGTGGGAVLQVYNSNGSGEKVSVVLPASGWTALDDGQTPRGYKYKDALGQHAGVKQMSLKASSLPKAKLKLVGRGPNLPDPTLPFALPVLVQLHASDGACWEAGFGVLESKRNDASGFSGRMRTP